MKLQYKEEKEETWKTFYEDTKEKVQEALEWNQKNAKSNLTRKDFRMVE